jgi:hypothetical protein
MSELHLLIDDVRDYEVDIIARNARAGKSCLFMDVTHLYLDHDLGDVDEPTGYDVLVWAIESEYLPPNVFLVTANPVGRSRMEAALLNAGYRKDGHWYRKADAE